MKMRNSGARRTSTPAGQGLANMEVIVVGDGFVRNDLRPGDHVLVDWSRLPGKGEIGAIRKHGNGVRFDVYKGDEPAMKMGRLVNPSILLQV